jgi:hypothetical protein
MELFSGRVNIKPSGCQISTDSEEEGLFVIEMRQNRKFTPVD